MNVGSREVLTLRDFVSRMQETKNASGQVRNAGPPTHPHTRKLPNGSSAVGWEGGGFDDGVCFHEPASHTPHLVCSSGPVLLILSWIKGLLCFVLFFIFGLPCQGSAEGGCSVFCLWSFVPLLCGYIGSVLLVLQFLSLGVFSFSGDGWFAASQTIFSLSMRAAFFLLFVF